MSLTLAIALPFLGLVAIAAGLIAGINRISNWHDDRARAAHYLRRYAREAAEQPVLGNTQLPIDVPQYERMW